MFSVGVRIPVAAAVRRRDESQRDWQSLQNGYFSPDRYAIESLRLGVELADGTRLGTGAEFPPPYRESEPDGPVLVNHGGGGGGGPDRWDLTTTLWLWPLPPEGELSLVAEWRSRGIPESRVLLDATAIRSAAAGVQPLWAD